MYENGDCEQLITKTAGALTDDVLKLLFVSVQQNNIDLCTRYAVDQYVEFCYLQDDSQRLKQQHQQELPQTLW
jgi:hypothetical protein